MDKYDTMEIEELAVEFKLRCPASANMKRSAKFMRNALRKQDESKALLKEVDNKLTSKIKARRAK